jgi:hypothetical protein
MKLIIIAGIPSLIAMDSSCQRIDELLASADAENTEFTSASMDVFDLDMPKRIQRDPQAAIDWRRQRDEENNRLIFVCLKIKQIAQQLSEQADILRARIEQTRKDCLTLLETGEDQQSQEQEQFPNDPPTCFSSSLDKAEVIAVNLLMADKLYRRAVAVWQQLAEKSKAHEDLNFGAFMCRSRTLERKYAVRFRRPYQDDASKAKEWRYLNPKATILKDLNWKIGLPMVTKPAIPCATLNEAKLALMRIYGMDQVADAHVVDLETEHVVAD